MVKKDIKIEELLSEELKRELFVDSGSKFRLIDEWDTLMESIYELPVEHDGYEKKLSESNYIKEIVDIITKDDFDQVKRTESRKKYKGKTPDLMYYNIVFTKGNKKTGYGTLIYFPETENELPQRNRGIVLAIKTEFNENDTNIEFEKARFDDYLVEVKPYIDLIGGLYREKQ